MKNKYDFSFKEENEKKICDRLVNKIWKLIPLKEEGKNYKYQIKIIIQELVGLKEIYLQNTDIMLCLIKLEGLNYLEEYQKDDFELYKKIVFRCIFLVKRAFCNE